MSRFNELTQLFDVWRKTWLDQYRQHQFLPPRIAKQFQKFIGCPEVFSDPAIDAAINERPQIKYVSPTRAEWNDDTGNFTLIAYDDAFVDVDFRPDGYFYFGLRVFLEHGPNTYPKLPFWFLFRGKFDAGQFTIWVQRSEKQFQLSVPNDETNALCEHLFDLLKEDLAESPISRNMKEPFRIGFTAPAAR